MTRLGVKKTSQYLQHQQIHPMLKVKLRRHHPIMCSLGLASYGSSLLSPSLPSSPRYLQTSTSLRLQTFQMLVDLSNPFGHFLLTAI